MKPARLVIGILIGTTLLPSAAVRAQEKVEVPEVRRINLNLKGTPFRRALEQVFLPGGLRVKLEADVPALPVTLALKEVDQDTAFRLLMRQAKKQVKDLQYAATDDGYRIFLGAPPEEKDSPYPLTPEPKLPAPFAPVTPDFPVVQSRELEPFVAGLLQQGENGNPVFPPPKETEGGVASSDAEFFPTAEGPTLGGGDFGGFGLGNDGFGGNGYGGIGYGPGFGGTGYGSYAPGGYGYGGYGLGGNAFGGFGGGLRGVLGPQLPRVADPYSSPLAGGLSVSDQISQRLYDDKKPRRPYFYDHQPQWILERRTHYWGNGRRPARGGGGKRSSPRGNDGPVGGGYLPR